MRMMGYLPALLLLGALLPAPALAIDRSKCNDDNVSEIPSFATTRDSQGCLILDPGNGDPLVPFQYETFHRQGISRTAIDGGETPTVDVLNIDRGDVCDGSQGCTMLVWDTVLDNYSDRVAKNDDLLFIGAGHRTEYLLIKDSILANTATCKGGTGWNGPNGLSCSAGETSASHVDGLQLRGQPVNDGWIVLQDTIFVNGFNYHLLMQSSAQLGQLGSFVIQGGNFGRLQSVGHATSWIDDCKKRHDQTNSNGTDICPEGRASITNDLREIWLIDVVGTTGVNPKGDTDKMVIVNTGCDKTSCDGSIGFDRGWPQPLAGWSTSGTGQCPNGQVTSYHGIPTYCYTSLENAAQSHKLPPFVQFSDSGWANPTGQGSGLPPVAPSLLP